MWTSKYILLVVVIFFSGFRLSAQEQWGSDARFAFGSLVTDFTFRSSQILNANANLSAGAGQFLTPRQFAALDLNINLAPLTQTYETTFRAGQLLTSTPTKLTVLAELHYGIFMGQYQSIIGINRNEYGYRAGLGLQLAYWLTPHTSIYLWPQYNLTNAEVFNVSLSHLQLPLGLQYSWHPKK